MLKSTSTALNRRRFLHSAAVLATGFAVPSLDGCGTDSGATGGSGYTGGISVPLYKQLPDNIPIIVGLAKGFFEASGLSLKPVTFSTGSDVIRSVVTQTHIGSSSPVSGMVAFGSGFPKIRIIGACLNAPTVVYVVAPESPIKDISQLKGKKVGVNAPTSITTYLGKAMVNEAGLDPDKDVQLIDVKGVSDSATALENGVVDCAWSSPPLSVQLIKEGRARVLYDAASKHPTFTQTALFSDSDFIESHADSVQGFIDAMAKSQAYVRDNVDDAGAIWAKALNIGRDIGVSTVKALAPHFTIELTEDGFDGNITAATTLGLLPKPIARSEMVDDTFTSRVRTS